MNQREAVERFHLVFLRHFATVVSAGTICLKGGVNLRLYHSSPRLSEDIDFDARVVGVEILKKNVNRVLASRPLLTELGSAGLTLSGITPAKQTQTVQRWKLQVNHEANRLATRLEFSRRSDEPFQNCVSEPPSPVLLAEHQMVPFVFNHYTPAVAYRQKIHALATRTQVQARDAFDLHHLSQYAAAGRGLPPALVTEAMDRLNLIDFEMFRDQVVPFLPADLSTYYGCAEAWQAILEKVRNDLVAALPPTA